MTDFVAYCGVYCPKCYAMVASEVAINLKKALKKIHICGSKHDPSAEFKSEIDELVNLRCTVFCKDNESDCIANCCTGKECEGCWECHDAQECPNLSQQFRENCSKINVIGLTRFIEEY